MKKIAKKVDEKNVFIEAFEKRDEDLLRAAIETACHKAIYYHVLLRGSKDADKVLQKEVKIIAKEFVSRYQKYKIL